MEDYARTASATFPTEYGNSGKVTEKKRVLTLIRRQPINTLNTPEPEHGETQRRRVGVHARPNSEGRGSSHSQPP